MARSRSRRSDAGIQTSAARETTSPVDAVTILMTTLTMMSRLDGTVARKAEIEIGGGAISTMTRIDTMTRTAETSGEGVRKCTTGTATRGGMTRLVVGGTLTTRMRMTMIGAIAGVIGTETGESRLAR